VVALRHLAPQGEELAALGHLHKDVCILYAEVAKLVRNRFIPHALILTQGSEPRQRAAAMVSNDASAASSFHASSLGAVTALA
jgi:hypothetical protein